MMNAALDGAYVFKTLVAPESNLAVLYRSTGAIGQANMTAWKQQVDQAQATAAGRARIALAATLAQIPAWITPNLPPPEAQDFASQQQQQLYQGLLGGTLLPRDDQEQRAGGNFSWNTGIDYAAQLKRSGREEFVRTLYRDAGLSLDQDLAALAKAPRIAAQPNAVAYMKKNYVPTGDIKQPMLLVQAVADPVTLVELTGAYTRLIQQAGHADLVRSAYTQRAGHCNFNLAETIAALQTVEQRLDRGQWNASAQAMNSLARSLTLDGSSFVEYQPAAFLRACSARPGDCPAEPHD
jgi:hypothetical protein